MHTLRRRRAGRLYPPPGAARVRGKTEPSGHLNTGRAEEPRGRRGRETAAGCRGRAVEGPSDEGRTAVAADIPRAASTAVPAAAVAPPLEPHPGLTQPTPLILDAGRLVSQAPPA